MLIKVPLRIQAAFLAVLTAALVSLVGCGAPTPDPTEVARLAAQAVAATLTAQPTVQIASVVPQTATPVPPLPTATAKPTDAPTSAPTEAPRPTDTPEPTAAPTATPRPPSAPDGWRFYELISGEAMLAFPATWEVFSETEGSVRWHAGKQAIVTIQDAAGATDMRVGADADTQARELKRLLLDAHSNLNNLTFPESGQLQAPGNPSYVIARTEESGIPITGWATFIAGQDHIMLLDAFYVDQTSILEGDLEILVQLADSVRFQPYTMPTPAPTATPEASPVVAKAGNLRAGPGTNYAVVGGVKVGEKLAAVGISADGAWLQVQREAGEAWISTTLVTKTDRSALPVKTSSAPTVTPAPKPTQAPQAAQKKTDMSSSTQIGQEIEAGGWRFKVSEVHKRKAVYFYDRSYVAQGHFLIVIIDATNLQPGTDYFMNSVRVYLTDLPGNTYDYSWKGSSYAEWQYSKDSAFKDVNPGVSVRMAIAYDLPDSLGDTLLSTGKLLQWIYLGNFSAMQSEDQ